METLNVSISPSFEIKDDRFDANQIADSHLLIEVGRDRFRFAIHHATNNMIMWLEDYQIFSLLTENQLIKTLKTIYKEHPYLTANYWRTIRLTVSSPNFTFLPEEYYHPDETIKYLQFSAGKVLTDTESIYEFKHNKFAAVNIFSIEKELISWFKEMYPAKKITPIHTLSTLIEGIVQEKNLNSLHLFFEDNQVSIIYFKDNKLQFCNRFAYRTSQDLVYHVLFVMNELNLQTDTQTIFYGEVTSFSESYTVLSNSLKNISFANNPSKIKFSQYFDELPEHRYFSLFSSFYLY
jgi:hypothetical protein